MSLKNIIDKEIKESMFNKNKMRLIALRAIKAAILLEEKSDSTSSLDENLLLMKLIKQRKDSLIFYKDQNRSDLADKENSEINIISEFLPEQITNEKLIEGILKIIENANASSMKDMGKVMGIATKKYKGQADNSRIAQIIKEKLN
jgi:uncharacterized protein|tara:strand:- start:5388 stop:5825 length:438 start_codon:yes stop_codon:yes gene_type:complete